jgi:ketosteroid isomerase-like protein
MPHERIEIVRQPLAVKATSRRPLEAQLLRFRRMVAFLAGAVWRLLVILPPRSRLRQAIPRHYVRLSLEALNRGDLDAAFALYHPNVESTFDQRFVTLGFERVYRSLEARIDMQRHWNAEWHYWRFEPKELVDLADGRFLITGHFKAGGRSTGIQVDSEGDFVLTISGGRVIREGVFLDHREALEAVGLSD